MSHFTLESNLVILGEQLVPYPVTGSRQDLLHLMFHFAFSVMIHDRLRVLVVHKLLVDFLHLGFFFYNQSRAFYPPQISRKAELRSRLAELQLQLSGPQQTLGILGDEKKEKMKRQV